jgi:DNA invertase Pin-like site-specific DNA recombinase
LANWFTRRTPLTFHTPELDETGPFGRAIIVIISAIAELERSLIGERVRVGIRVPHLRDDGSAKRRLVSTALPSPEIDSRV